MNNIHTVEVSTNPGLALVERPTNSIDAMLDLAHLLRRENANSPSEAAEKWYGVNEGDLSKMEVRESRSLSESIAIRMMDSGDDDRPTVQIQDRGTGQHPDDWSTTLLSLQESNKKSSMHLMGVYNSGGSASFKFSQYTVIISRRHPELLDDREDEVGVSVVRYNALDPDKFKTGTYEYCITMDQDILRLDLLDNKLDFALSRGEGKLIHGTVFRHIAYELDRYSGPAHLPRRSLAHLMGAALPAPVLPLRFYEERVGPKYRRIKHGYQQEWRVVLGNLYRLNRNGVSEYSDRRVVELGEHGEIILHYHAISHEKQPDNYVSKDQALTVIHNGQRQIIKSRHWLKQKTGLNFLWKRLVVHVDASNLSNIAKRSIFSSTREGGVESKPLRELLTRVVGELLQDGELRALEERDKQMALENSTRSTSRRLKRRLAREISKRIKGTIGGSLDGIEVPVTKSTGVGRPPGPEISDEHLPDVPTKLTIVNGPLKINPGTRKSVLLEIDAKNGFLHRHEAGLRFEFGQELGDRVYIQSTGSLVGGRTRVVIYCEPETQLDTGDLVISLNIPELDVLLTDHTTITVSEPAPDRPTKPRGGEPDIQVSWVSAEKMRWTQLNVGRCDMYRGLDGNSVAGVHWYLSEDFHSFALARDSKDLTEDSLEQFNDSYAYPICMALFRSELELEKLAKELESKGRALEIPNEHRILEHAIMAHGISTAISPGIEISEPDYSLRNMRPMEEEMDTEVQIIS